MPLVAVGHKRTGACPTFERPVLQRDGHLVRVPLVGGALTPDQATAVAQVSATGGTGIIELTNRGNLQIRGIRSASVDAVLDALRAAGLGAPGAALVTISPFAGSAEFALRTSVEAAVHAALADGPVLSPKFVVHIDDAFATTASRRAEIGLALVGDRCRVRVAGVGECTTSVPSAVAASVALAQLCRTLRGEARVADLLEAHGNAWVRSGLDAALDGPVSWRAIPVAEAAPALRVGPTTLGSGRRVVLAAARFGRVEAAALAGLAELSPANLTVTPWRSFALPSPEDEQELARRLAELGFLVDPADPAAHVIACVGAAGCWQTEADTLARAEQVMVDQIVTASPGSAINGIIHVTGCDKRCATRGPVALTLLGRADGSGFDELVSP